MFGVHEDMFYVPKTSSICATGMAPSGVGEPPGDSYLNQWQWPLYSRGAWQQCWFC